MGKQLMVSLHPACRPFRASDLCLPMKGTLPETPAHRGRAGVLRPPALPARRAEIARVTRVTLDARRQRHEPTPYSSTPLERLILFPSRSPHLLLPPPALERSRILLASNASVLILTSVGWVWTMPSRLARSPRVWSASATHANPRVSSCR